MDSFWNKWNKLWTAEEDRHGAILRDYARDTRLFRFRETCILSDESRTQTRLSLRLAAPNAMPIVGGVIDRFDVRKMAAERVDERLQALRSWCESTPPGDGAFAHGSPA